MFAAAYCSNLAPADTVADILGHLADFTAPLRQDLGHERIGLDLHLGGIAIDELVQQDDLVRALRIALDAAGAEAHTINAFPLDRFQDSRVKERAYAPDWSRDQRISRTEALITIAPRLCDTDSIAISTLPGSFKPWGGAGNDPLHLARCWGRWAGLAARAERDDHGRQLILCPEPEPWCHFEYITDVCAFWQGPLATEGLAAARTVLEGDVAAARRALTRHLGVCIDTCHLSCQFEDPTAAIETLVAADIPIAKCQYSAAPRLPDTTDTEAVAALRGLAEPRFLHQTAARSPAGSILRISDLDQLDRLVARSPAGSEIRSHFHIPVHRQEAGRGLASTVDESTATLAACRSAGCRHVSVETYTWSLLADAPERRDGCAAELRALRSRLDAGTPYAAQ